MNGIHGSSALRLRRLMLLAGAFYTTGLLAAPLRQDRNAAPLDLAQFGGRPGAGREQLQRAFAEAFSTLASAGGGTLLVAPGHYDFGDVSQADSIIRAENLRDVHIAANGASFSINTTADVVPTLFVFQNPNRVLLSGAAFHDRGYKPLVNWRGMYAVAAVADRECSGFSMVDCTASGVVGLFHSQSEGASRYQMHDVRIQGRVSQSYYGASLAYVGDNLALELECENVRRACIAYALRNGSIRVRARHLAGQPASNGLISLVSEGTSRGDVENVRIGLDARGSLDHNALVHFYHQGMQAEGSIRNVDATVISRMTPVKGKGSIFRFDHEVNDGIILKTTARSWQNISLHADLAPPLPDTVIYNPSVSLSASSITLDADLARKAGAARLPPYFTARPAQ